MTNTDKHYPINEDVIQREFQRLAGRDADPTVWVCLSLPGKSIRYGYHIQFAWGNNFDEYNGATTSDLWMTIKEFSARVIQPVVDRLKQKIEPPPLKTETPPLVDGIKDFAISAAASLKRIADALDAGAAASMMARKEEIAVDGDRIRMEYIPSWWWIEQEIKRRKWVLIRTRYDMHKALADIGMKMVPND